MKVSRTELGRRIARWGVGLLQIPFGLWTIFLLFTSGSLAPETFTSWDQLGCNPMGAVMIGGKVVESTPQFMWLTDCGRAYIVLGQGKSREDSASPNKAVLYDVFTDKKLGAVDSIGQGTMGFFSRDLKHLLLDTPGNNVIIRDLVSGLDLVKTKASTDIQQSSLNKFSNIALIRSDQGGSIWDMGSGRQLSSFQRPRKSISFGFCDRDGHAKCLTIGENLEIWNEETDSMDFILKANSNRSEVVHFSPDYRRLAFLDSKIHVWSLEAGIEMRTIPIPGDCIRIATISSGSALVRSDARIRFSNNARWLAQEYPQRPVWLGWKFDLWYLLAHYLPVRDVALLVDLESDRTWHGIPAGQGVAFSEDDTRMVTFSEEGKYVWTLPPRWQYFTLWTWVALGILLSLFAIWFNLRKCKHSAA